MSYVENVIDTYKALGADFVGCIVNLSVGLTTDCELVNFRDVFLGSASLPDEWAPEAESDLKLYLNTMLELNRSSLKKFDYNPETLPFAPEDHAGYHVKRMFLRKDAEIPTVHKIIHMVSHSEPEYDENDRVIGRKIVDVEADVGIKILLKRVEGSAKTDKTGESVWAFHIEHEGDHLDPRYLPFINTLKNRFTAKRNRKYGSKEIRDMVLDVMKKGLKVDNIKRGFYYLPPSKMDVAYELRDRLSNLDRGIDLFLIGIPVYEDPALNDAYHMTRLGLSENIVKELKEFSESIDTLVSSESETRESTWGKKLDELQGFRDKIREYEFLKVLHEDFMTDLMDEIKEKISENI